MTQPAPRFSANAQQLMTVIKRQSWLLFAVILLVIVGEAISGHRDFAISKNLLAGGVLAWASHYVFAKLSLRTFGAKFRRQMVNNFYLAHLLKWLMTMVGFALIFILLKPLKPMWVFLGYVILQIGQVVLLYQYNNRQVKENSLKK